MDAGLGKMKDHISVAKTALPGTNLFPGMRLSFQDCSLCLFEYGREAEQSAKSPRREWSVAMIPRMDVSHQVVLQFISAEQDA